jgi:Tol biopolymer transport system component
VPELLERLQQALADRYRIERELGAGGMATVYLAEDLRHRRPVALKVLKPEIAATMGAGRFAREIEVAARLQHPNILPLLDSGEAGGFFFYVMPYVEGESLRDRLARGGELPIPDAVRILMEVADALSEAHAHGVVHRDIKPDNVMLRGRHALVTDFGVAKAVTEATAHQVLTSTGVALGTPTYMAPEQATADPHQDHRVDIYALGVLGYELLTGRAPYTATTAAEMLAAHMTAQPEPLEKYRPTVSPPLAQIILKCLAKKPADRWQTAEEVLQHLEPLATPSGGTTPTQTAPIEAAKMGHRFSLAAAGTGFIAVAAVAILAYQLLRAKPLRITVSDQTQVTNDPGVEFQPAISPDGKEVAYVAGPIDAPHLFVRSTVSATAAAAVRVGDSSLGSEWFPSWTPDGQFVRFWGCARGHGPFAASGCSAMEVGKLGGPAQPMPLGPAAQHRGALSGLSLFGASLAWSPEGDRLVFGTGDTLYVTSIADSMAQVLTVDTAWRVQGGPDAIAWSPDGSLVAHAEGNFWWRVSGNVLGSSLGVVSATGGRAYSIASPDHLNISPAWLDAAHLLFVSDRDGDRALYVVRVGTKGRVGEPQAIAGVADPHSISYSIASRKLAWAKFTLRQNIWAYPLGHAGSLSIHDGRRVTTGSQVVENQDVSRDGRWIAYAANLRGRTHLFKVPTTGGQPIPLTSGRYEEYPSWSPDGKQIAFAAFDSAMARASLVVMSADGGTPTPVTTGGWTRWSPNGRQIVFQQHGRARIVSRDSVGGRWSDPRLLSDSIAICNDWTPDSGSLLCRDLRRRWQIVSSQDSHVLRSDLFAGSHLTPTWWAHLSHDGRTIYVPATDSHGRKGVWAVPTTGGAARLVVAFDDPSLTPWGGGFFSVGPDHLYLTVSEYESDIWVATLNY